MVRVLGEPKDTAADETDMFNRYAIGVRAERLVARKAPTPMA